jgi:hypothetical protein
MECTLTSPSRRILFLSAALLVVFVLVGAGGRVYLAARAAASEAPEALARALRLEPGNAAYWHRYGLFYQFDFAQADIEKAIAHLERAAELNPHEANYWLDLAAAREAAGRIEPAREAFLRAQQAYPVSAEVGWKYGNFLLRQGELEAALAEIRRAVDTDLRLARLAAALCWRTTGDAERVLDEALPARREAYLAALSFFLSERQTEAALAAWTRLAALGQPVPLREGLPLIEVLMRGGRVDRARQVWIEALRIAGEDPERKAATTLVWDGGFERGLVYGGFGWRSVPVPGAEVELDSSVFRSPPRALRIRFDGRTNVAFQHVTQYVVVEPGRRYRFEAYLRTEGVSTDSGIRFWIADAEDPLRLDLVTPATGVVGTQPWSLEEAEFTASPQTRLVRIAVRRDPSRKLDNKLRGTVWVDDVSLTAVELAGPGARR